MKTILIVLLLGSGLACAAGQTPAGEVTSAQRGTVATAGGHDTLYVFRFVAGNDMFYVPWKNNGAKLAELVEVAGRYRCDLLAGRIQVEVNGYCASQSSGRQNLKMAAVRSNRVKSELILRAGLSEACFVTRNHAARYDGWNDVVTVSVRIPAKVESVQAGQPESSGSDPFRDESPVVVEPARQPEPPAEEQPAETTVIQAAEPRTGVLSGPYSFAVRTNVLYDAFLLPTLGAEWRVNNSVGIRLDGSLARWSGAGGKVQKVWVLNPEARWYLLEDKRFYVGVWGSYGEYNLYKYMLGGLFKDDTGYQGKLWSAGLSAGYQLYLSRRFSVDFNFGLGYIRSEYDSFRIIDGTRVYERRNGAKNFWGPAQAGISLVWTIGSNSEK